MKDYKRNRVENWLQKHYRYISIQAIEKELKFPKGTIQKTLKYDRNLNDERIKIVFNFLKKMTQF